MSEDQIRPWAKVSEVREGSILATDESHSCMMAGVNRVVQNDSRLGLYVTCGKGTHSLHFHKTYDGLEYVGFYHVQ